MNKHKPETESQFWRTNWWLPDRRGHEGDE